MAAPRTRTWTEGLENLGENLMRLSSAVQPLRVSLESPAPDAQSGPSISQLAGAYAKAFRMAPPVLRSGEAAFLALVPAELPNLAYAAPGEVPPQQAHTLIHEAILGAQEMVSLLDRLAESEGADPTGTLTALRGLLPSLAESAAAVGWELKAVCHEFESEVKLAGGSPASLPELGPGAVGLITDLAQAARNLRVARREWYRLEQQLAAFLGSARTK